MYMSYLDKLITKCVEKESKSAQAFFGNPYDDVAKKRAFDRISLEVYQNELTFKDLNNFLTDDAISFSLRNQTH